MAGINAERIILGPIIITRSSNLFPATEDDVHRLKTALEKSLGLTPDSSEEEVRTLFKIQSERSDIPPANKKYVDGTVGLFVAVLKGKISPEGCRKAVDDLQRIIKDDPFLTQFIEESYSAPLTIDYVNEVRDMIMVSLGLKPNSTKDEIREAVLKKNEICGIPYNKEYVEGTVDLFADLLSGRITAEDFGGRLISLEAKVRQDPEFTNSLTQAGKRIRGEQ